MSSAIACFINRKIVKWKFKKEIENIWTDIDGVGTKLKELMEFGGYFRYHGPLFPIYKQWYFVSTNKSTKVNLCCSRKCFASVKELTFNSSKFIELPILVSHNLVLFCRSIREWIVIYYFSSIHFNWEIPSFSSKQNYWVNLTKKVKSEKVNMIKIYV